MQLHFHGDQLITIFSEGDIGTTLYEWHSPISSKKLDFGTYHEKVLNLEERKSDNEDEPCVDSSHETIYYKVLLSFIETRFFSVPEHNYVPCSV